MAARRRIGWPVDMPPSMPPARAVLRPMRPSREHDLVVRLGAGPARRREPVAHLDPLHGLDAHEGERETRVQLAVVVHVRAESRRRSVRHAPRTRRPRVSFDRRIRSISATILPAAASSMHRTGDASIASRSASAGTVDRARHLHGADLHHVGQHADPQLGQERLAARPDRDPGGGLPRAGALQDVAHVVEPVLLHAHQVRVPGPRTGQTRVGILRALDRHEVRVLRLELDVRDRDRHRRPEALPVAHARQDLEPVRLEALPAASSVAVAASRELPGDLLRDDAHAGREALQDRDQRLPVRFAGREHPQHAAHHKGPGC